MNRKLAEEIRTGKAAQLAEYDAKIGAKLEQEEQARLVKLRQDELAREEEARALAAKLIADEQAAKDAKEAARKSKLDAIAKAKADAIAEEERRLEEVAAKKAREDAYHERRKAIEEEKRIAAERLREEYEEMERKRAADDLVYREKKRRDVMLAEAAQPRFPIAPFPMQKMKHSHHTQTLRLP